MPKIRRSQIFGERNSGTNYARKLIRDNMPEIKTVAGDRGFGWKHGDLGNPWCIYKEDGKLFCHDIKDYKTQSKNVLFVVVYRNPFIWLQSMHKTPHHAPTMFRLGFSDFLKEPWKSYYSLPGQDMSENLEERESIMTKKNLFEEYKNVLDLRVQKTKIYENFINKVNHVAYINYEAIAEDPFKVLSAISDVFDIQFNKEEFENISEDKFGLGKFKPKKYPLYSEKDYKTVKKALDWDLEEKIGYSLKEINKPSNSINPFKVNQIDAVGNLEFKFKLRYSIKGETGSIDL